MGVHLLEPRLRCVDLLMLVEGGEPVLGIVRGIVEEMIRVAAALGRTEECTGTFSAVVAVSCVLPLF